MKIVFIGAGKVGKTLAKLITLKTSHHIIAISNKVSTQQSCEFIGAGATITNIEDLPSADLYFITTPDSEIEVCCQRLVAQATIPKEAIIIHCSGALPSGILHCAKHKGIAIASVHPIKSFALPEQSIKSFAGTYCAYEGDASCFPSIASLFSEIGGKVFKLSSDNKARYHAAGAFASNFIVSLFDISTKLLQQSGVDKENAIDISLSLMTSTLENLKTTRSANESLTGPVARGDTATINQHIAALDNQNLQQLYAMLSTYSLDLTKLSAERKHALKILLS